jgi:hypothetical protein
VLRRLLPLCLAGVLVACGGDGSSSDATTVPSDADAPAPTGSPTGAAVPEALQFTAPLLGGGDIEMAALAGRPVLLWFWAPW